MKTPLDIQGEFSPHSFQRNRWNYLAFLFVHSQKRCSEILHLVKQSLQQTKPVWISFCSIASMHVCCITFQPRFYNLRSACNFIGAHLFKASSAPEPTHQVLYCVLLCFVVFCISAVRKEHALLYCSRVILGSFLSLFRFKSCFDCLETRNNGRVSKYSELPN